MPPTMFAPVPTRPRSNPFRRPRGAAPLLPHQIVTAVAGAKRPAESSTSASSSFRSVVLSTTSSTALDAAAPRPEKRPRRQDADEARPAASECSEVIGGPRPRHPASEVEASESSCLGSVLESDLACPEHLADTTDYSSACDEITQSDAEEEVLSAPSPCGCADYSLTPYLTSSSSSDDEADDDAPSITFTLFLDYAKEFVSCVHPEAHTVADVVVTEGKRFEDLDDEESYERFRQRERRGVVARDYTEVYGCMSGDHGRDVVEQRAVMVNWIIEHVHLTDLQPETLFMGIGLMDRFLTRGYLKGPKNVQLLGIACITLATRIEENQPYNSIMQNSFTVGINMYSRSEVVAMEWLIQEVLDFQCFVTTVHHFLWFYLKAAKADEKMEDLAKHLALLSLLDHKHLSYWPSTVAASVVALACLATNNEESCHLVMETHVRTKNDDLPECLMSLEWLINYAS